MKLIGQPAVKLWGFFANCAISRRELDLWPFDFEIGPRSARVPGTLPTKFGLPRPYRVHSRWRHTTDKRTDRRTERPLPWQRGHPVQGGKGSLRYLPNIKLIGQQAAKLSGFFANNAISRRDLDLWPLDLEISPRGAGVPGTLPTKFGIRRLFRFPSRCRHGTDRQTDRQSDRINTWCGILLGRMAP